jgi:uncharacterized protein (TIGR03437 family)
LSVFLGKGDGTFQSLPPYSLARTSGSLRPAFAAAADLNGDGRADVVAVSQSPDVVAVALGKGDGTFLPATFFTPGKNSKMAAIGDLNGDGRPDIVVANAGGDANTDPGSLSIFLSSGGGNFQTPRTVAAGSHPVWVAIRDLNGDGKPDLVVSNFGSNLDKDAGGIEVLLGNGDGTFKAPVLYPAGFYPASLTVADVDLDGKPDIIAATNNQNFIGRVAVLLGHSDGTFGAATLLTASQPIANIAVGDFNGDGKPDLIVANCCGETDMTYFLGNGDGTFGPETTFNGGASPSYVATADFNGDGKPDLVMANALGPRGFITVLLNATQPPALATLTNKLAAGGSLNIASEALVTATPLGSAKLASADAMPSDITVSVQDSAGKARTASVASVAPGQVTYQMPAGTATGTATVTITSPGGLVNIGTAKIVPVSPGLFTTGDSIASGYVLRNQADGTQAIEPLSQTDDSGNVTPVPIALNAPDDQVFLVLYGTGVRAAAVADIKANVGGFDVPVQSNTPDSSNIGLDDLTIGPLPADLTGQGNEPVALTAAGVSANVPYVAIQ